jgi:hypothetical protein
MIQTFKAYRALSAGDRQLVREAAFFLCLSKLGIAILPFSVVRAVFEKSARSPQPTRRREVAPLQRVCWIISAVARRFPIQTTCLIESFTVNAMLRRRGYCSEVRFGVRPPDAHTLAAHAWVEHDGTIVFGDIHNLDEYSVLAASFDGSGRAPRA